MKIILLSVIIWALIVSLRASPGSEKVKKVVIEYLRNGRAHLTTVLHHMRADVDKKLIELFPVLKKKVEKLHGDINECYDQSIGRNNETVNIFEAKVGQVVEKFFETHGQLLDELSLSQIQKRIKVFLHNLAELAQLLIKCAIRKTKGKPTIKLGLTSMVAYSQDEIGNRKPASSPRKGSKPILLKAGDRYWDKHCNWDRRSSDQTIPERFSWAEQGYVSPVVDHKAGQCNAGYVFAAVAALESQYMIRSKTKTPLKLSEQAVLNCMKDGCAGGTLFDPIRYMTELGAPLLGHSLYQAKTSACSKYPFGVKSDAHCFYSWLYTDQMQRLLLRMGPASVWIDGNSEQFRYLKNSAYIGTCGENSNVPMLLVGWDERNWILKSSYGEGWGIKGYLHLPRDDDNKCGIRTDFGVPVIDAF